MKIQCDVCEKAPATLICCADEAALCAKCDVEIHAANRLASKHQRLLLQSFSTNKLPLCDICREKTAFIFCVEDRALFCHDCDEPIHSANTRAANHQRFLATGVRVALSSSSNKDSNYKQDDHPQPPPPPPHNTSHHLSFKPSLPDVSSITTTPSWSVDELLHLSECENSISDKKETLEFGGGIDWLTDISLFGEHMAHHEQALTKAAEVPQLPLTQSSSHGSYRTPRYYMPYKKARIELPIDNDDDDEYFTVPDLG